MASKTDETERYRRAAEDANSRALAKNRSYIRTQLLDRPEQPAPALKTDET